jgi:hypothetical protein
MDAQRLLDDPMLKGAFEAVEARILEEMRRVDVGAREAQRDLIVTLQLLGSLKRHLKTHMETGRLAQISKETMKDKARRMFRAA